MLVQFTRFTAAEISPRAFKARAISYVVAGGALAAVVGPERLMAVSGART
jgi:predicted MFS family arabinose efflux permease